MKPIESIIFNFNQEPCMEPIYFFLIYTPLLVMAIKSLYTDMEPLVAICYLLVMIFVAIREHKPKKSY